jgi:multidrug resistance efflux pump
VGQQVTPGQPVMRLADLSKLYVETDDLTEIEVVDVEVGQKVTVIADALPSVEMTGTVESIGQVFEEKRGDITYTVRIALDDPDPHLLWGMTVVVTFE